MAKRHLFLHIGPDVVDLDGLRAQLDAGGIAMPDVTREDLDRADVEIRRIHRSVGLRRKEVEGAWARVCRRTFRSRSHALISQPGFWHAETEQAALALDGLHGLKVHLVTTRLGGLPPAWAGRVKPERVHVIDGVGPLAAEVVRLTLTEERARLDTSLRKLTARRTQVEEKLSA